MKANLCVEAAERPQWPRLYTHWVGPGLAIVCSGVGTVAAVAALAATLFRPKINIHNLL